MAKRIIVYSIVLTSLIFLVIYFFKLTNKEQNNQINSSKNINDYNSNIIKNVNYSSQDLNGNEYIINADQGEIDLSNTNIIYLTKVRGLIKLNDGNEITIKSNYGKYDINNYDTIFNRNVDVKYLDNNIIGQYLDVSINRNTLIMSKDVIYKNPKNILRADVVEMNIKTKDTKIYMHDTKKKVKIKSKN